MNIGYWNTNKHTNKIVIAANAKVGNGTVVKSQLKNSDTEYYQVDKHGDYIQEGH